MSKTLPPLPHHPDNHVMTWTDSERRSVECHGESCYAAGYNDALAAIAAQGVPDCKVVDIGFRWDADRQEHVPSIKVEFAPVKANSPNDAKGWKDRDALAAMLAAPKASGRRSDWAAELCGCWRERPCGVFGYYLKRFRLPCLGITLTPLHQRVQQPTGEKNERLEHQTGSTGGSNEQRHL